MDRHLLVFSSWPQRESAREAAKGLVESRLAACVHILPQASSIYVWEEELHEDQEHLMICKTMQHRYPELERKILACHPYELPEIVALPITGGLPGYLAWVEAYARQSN
ncbi:MAG: divalent-cation tolerance protein CutA [Gammaproteobacteria bacterium]|jgi:periplasmic divalent cation tolerance protein|nr:divalent-cation tolerance protein CutA [Gammaproteobacteria bacterium]